MQRDLSNLRGNKLQARRGQRVVYKEIRMLGKNWVTGSYIVQQRLQVAQIVAKGERMRLLRKVVLLRATFCAKKMRYKLCAILLQPAS